jgi:hypothetical protein
MGTINPFLGGPTFTAPEAQIMASGYVDEHLYNIQCSEICTLRHEKLHTET